MKVFVKNYMIDNSICLQECNLIEIVDNIAIITSITNNLKVAVNKNRIIYENIN